VTKPCQRPAPAGSLKIRQFSIGFAGFMQKTSASRIAAFRLPAASLQIDAGMIDESGPPPFQ
jgi:hypothetical protein